MNTAEQALRDLEKWCENHASNLSTYGRPNQATNAVWDVIDEIRLRRAEIQGTEG